MAWILAGMMAVTVVVGVVYGPNSQGRSLEEIQEDQDGTKAANGGSAGAAGSRGVSGGRPAAAGDSGG